MKRQTAKTATLSKECDDPPRQKIKDMKTVLPDNILRCMTPEARMPLGKAGKTNAEAIAKHSYGQERRLHQQICQSRTDKRATNGAGVPDFIIFRRDQPELCVEVKVGKNELSGDQELWRSNYYFTTGRPVPVIRSLEELKTLLDATPNNRKD